MSWTIKKAPYRRFDTFKLWHWRRLLRVPRTARRLNQSILKEINPEYSLEGLMIKQKLQYFGHLIQRANSLEMILMLGKIEGRRRDNRGQDGWMASPTQWTWVWANSGRWWRTGKPATLQSMGLQRVRHDLATEQQIPYIKLNPKWTAHVKAKSKSRKLNTSDYLHFRLGKDFPNAKTIEDDITE